MQIKIPENVEKIINTLEAAGFEAYAVGGCIRDSLLGREPNDWDITTSARPEETKKLFKKTFDTGIKHGTVSVLMDRTVYEVTTYRIDGEYEDSRHPKSVVFTDRLSEDLMRRDFTINAMAYNPQRGLTDLYGGKDDLKNGIIRCVGDPEERFKEDALRILRAVRFGAQLNFSIEDTTRSAIKKLSYTLENISAERIQVELVKMLTSDHPEYLLTEYELGITKVILPEFDKMINTPQNNPHHCYNVGEHTVEVIKRVRPDRVMRLAALLHDVAKPDTRTTDAQGIDHFYDHPDKGVIISKKFFDRLKFDNDTKEKVCALVGAHDWTIGANAAHIRRYINRIGEDCFPDIFELNYADTLSQSMYDREKKLKHLDRLKAAYEEVMAKNECVSLKTLAVTGKDLIDAGYKPGPEIGKKLSELLEKVIDDPSLNDKEKLLKLL